jgi:hypothetical protein
MGTQEDYMYFEEDGDDDGIPQFSQSLADLVLMQEDLPEEVAAPGPANRAASAGRTVTPSPPLTPNADESSFRRFTDGGAHIFYALHSGVSGASAISPELEAGVSSVPAEVTSNSADELDDTAEEAVELSQVASLPLNIFGDYYAEAFLDDLSASVECDIESGGGSFFSGSCSGSEEAEAVSSGGSCTDDDNNEAEHASFDVLLVLGQPLDMNHCNIPGNNPFLPAAGVRSALPPVAWLAWLARARHDGEARLTAAAKMASPFASPVAEQRPGGGGSLAVAPVSATPNKRRVGCACQRTKCLKLYCECFSAGNTCVPSGSLDSSGCACRGCANAPKDLGSVQRQAAVVKCLAARSRTFRPRTQVARAEDMPLQQANVLCSPAASSADFGGWLVDAVSPVDEEGAKAAPPPPPRCFCKKSRCVKLYCDCFAAGLHCEDGRCRCTNCQNLPTISSSSSSSSVGSGGALSSPKAAAAAAKRSLAEAFATPTATAPKQRDDDDSSSRPKLATTTTSRSERMAARNNR